MCINLDKLFIFMVIVYGGCNKVTAVMTVNLEKL